MIFDGRLRALDERHELLIERAARERADLRDALAGLAAPLGVGERAFRLASFVRQHPVTGGAGGILAALLWRRIVGSGRGGRLIGRALTRLMLSRLTRL